MNHLLSFLDFVARFGVHGTWLSFVFGLAAPHVFGESDLVLGASLFCLIPGLFLPMFFAAFCDELAWDIRRDRRDAAKRRRIQS
tara:strand:- start:1943 stop:2194 length:252 start_codon:yes stop_codon:yes gene_type:complete